MAQDFDVANSEYLTLAAAVATAGPIVMACWHRADDKGDSVVMSIDNTGGSNNYFRLGIKSSVVNVRTRSIAQGSGDALSGAITADGATWEHFAGYYAQTSRYAYINGTPGSENTADITPVGLNRTEIGRNSSAGIYADGELAEVAIYYNAGLTKAIADQIIASLAKGFSSLLVKPEWLVGYWPLIRDYDGRVGGDMGLGAAPDVAVHCPIIYPAPPHIVHLAAGAPPAGIPILRRRREAC